MEIDLSAAREIRERAEQWERSANKEDTRAQKALENAYPEVAQHCRQTAHSFRIIAVRQRELANRIALSDRF